MKQYSLSTAAELDLNEIWEYIARDSVDAADRWIRRLFSAFGTLAKNPRIGHKRDDLTPLPVLFWPVESYLIVYRVRSTQVEIVGVTHGAQDIPAFIRRHT